MLFILSVLIAVGGFFAWFTARKRAEFNVMVKKSATIAALVGLAFSPSFRPATSASSTSSEPFPIPRSSRASIP